MARRQFDARWQELRERVLVGRDDRVQRRHHASGIAGARDRQHAGVTRHDRFGALAEATRDDDLARLLQGLTDRAKALFNRGRYEAASVDDDDIGVAVIISHFVTFGANLRQDAFTVHQRFGAAEADESNFSICSDSRHQISRHKVLHKKRLESPRDAAAQYTGFSVRFYSATFKC